MATKTVNYSIDVDRDRLLVTLRVSGFVSPGDIARIAADEQAAVQSLGVPSGVHRFLIDARAMDVQTAETVAFVQHTTDTIPLKPGRFAVITRYGLNGIQTRRTVGDREIGIFTDEESALAYLMA